MYPNFHFRIRQHNQQRLPSQHLSRNTPSLSHIDTRISAIKLYVTNPKLLKTSALTHSTQNLPNQLFRSFRKMARTKQTMVSVRQAAEVRNRQRCIELGLLSTGSLEQLRARLQEHRRQLKRNSEESSNLDSEGGHESECEGQEKMENDVNKGTWAERRAARKSAPPNKSNQIHKVDEDLEDPPGTPGSQASQETQSEHQIVEYRTDQVSIPRLNSEGCN